MTFPRPVMSYPTNVSPYRNLAREWINTHPKEWAELKLKYNVPPDPAIEISAYRDFIPPTGTTPAEEPDLPLTLEEAPW